MRFLTGPLEMRTGVTLLIDEGRDAVRVARCGGV